MAKKKVLVIDGGGRGHALVWKLAESKDIDVIFVAPGNAGTEKLATNVAISVKDINGLLEFAKKSAIDLTIVGQDDTLGLGIVNVFRQAGLTIFGPTRGAAQIEGSKSFAKSVMTRAGVGTATFVETTRYLDAVDVVVAHFLNESAKPLVIKADGLALGKGTYVCRTEDEAKQALEDLMAKRVHGSAGDRVIIEDFLEGREVSIHVFCDARSFQMFPPAQDHKRLLDGDQGPNTGGLGAVAPLPWFSPSLMAHIDETVIAPTLAEMWERGCPFEGLLYPGLMVGETMTSVLEFNARFGDPETQAYMRLLATDLLEILVACAENRLREVPIKWYPGFAACVVLASEGYPSPNYRKGELITGIEEAEQVPRVKVFHAGTKNQDGFLTTSGGRVLGVTALAGDSLNTALVNAYAAVSRIHFAGMHYRRDIGLKSLAP